MANNFYYDDSKLEIYIKKFDKVAYMVALDNGEFGVVELPTSDISFEDGVYTFAYPVIQVIASGKRYVIKNTQ